jgi:hypothetical protein
MPPSAPEALVATEEEDEAAEAVAVLLENGALDEMIVGRAEAVEETATASTVTVEMTREQLDAAALVSAGDEASVPTASLLPTGVVSAAWV